MTPEHLYFKFKFNFFKSYPIYFQNHTQNDPFQHDPLHESAKTNIITTWKWNQQFENICVFGCRFYQIIPSISNQSICLGWNTQPCLMPRLPYNSIERIHYLWQARPVRVQPGMDWWRVTMQQIWLQYTELFSQESQKRWFLWEFNDFLWFFFWQKISVFWLKFYWCLFTGVQPLELVNG